jgi:broad specificity phosphatase PhoE
MADQVATSPPPRGDQFAEVVVVRHGETSWNASRIIQGQMDPELNKNGRHQALVVRTVPRIMMQDHSKTIYSGPV